MNTLLRTSLVFIVCLALSSCAYYERKAQEKEAMWARINKRVEEDQKGQKAMRDARLTAYIYGGPEYRKMVNERDAREEHTRRIEESNRAVVDAIKKNAAKSEETYCIPYGYGVNCTTTKFPPD